jgi:hypothetical protein
MRHKSRVRLLATLAATVLLVPAPAFAGRPLEVVETFEYSANMLPLGASERAVPLSGSGSAVLNSDLAFWGDLAAHGNYHGFRIVDISDPGDPRELVNYSGCAQGTGTANQGDVVVWETILVRSWNSPAPAAGSACGDVAVPPFQEGLHVFDISDPANPAPLTFVSTTCGSHTATGVPDLANNRLLIYNSPSSGSPGCRGIDLVEIPLDDPQDASHLRFLPSGSPSGPLVEIDPPSSAAGTIPAAGATFGPAPTPEGVSGDVVLADDGSDAPTLACQPLVGFQAGAIALVDRGACNFTVKVANAQAAGATAVIVANNIPGAPSTMGGDDPTIVIPSVMVSLADGAAIRAGLPATGTVGSLPPAADPDRSCHDTGVILGEVNLAACAGGDGFSVWSLDPDDGGSLTEPRLLYSRAVPGVSVGHSAAFSWDGEVLVFGHEPGGGGQPRCQETSTEVDRTMFFYAARTGELAGTLIRPRPQSATENCTWHNYDVVPTDRHRVLVSGNYQGGVSVIDFTDPANPTEIAFADPAPLTETGVVVGGDWATYWYDGHIYESDIRRGLIIWKLADPAVAGARKLGHVNPQTQETSFPLRSTGRG